MRAFGGVYDGCPVLVTGHTGFKGSWLALWLQRLGARVAGLSLPAPSEPSHHGLVALSQIVADHEVDLRDFAAVRGVIEAVQPTVVFHLAAQPLVRASYADPKGTFDVNVGGTINLLEALRQVPGVRACVVISSDKCYDNREWVWGYRECDPLGGHDPYSASKGALEIVTAAYRRSFFAVGTSASLGLATARAGNVIGGGDWAEDRIIPDCVRALSANKPIVVRNPAATRPWQHVLEPLSGYLLLAQRLLEAPERWAGAWNFGPLGTERLTVGQMVEQFIGCWGEGAVQGPPPGTEQPHEAHLLQLSIDKAVDRLDWRPTLDAETAIAWTADWYRRWHEGSGDLRQTSLDDIAAYAERAARAGQPWAR